MIELTTVINTLYTTHTISYVITLHYLYPKRKLSTCKQRSQTTKVLVKVTLNSS